MNYQNEVYFKLFSFLNGHYICKKKIFSLIYFFKIIKNDFKKNKYSLNINIFKYLE
jgi:hypothetical protein